MKTTSIELREHRSDWFEVKAWIVKDDGTIFNMTEASDIKNIWDARRIAAAHIYENILRGCERITFYHSEPN